MKFKKGDYLIHKNKKLLMQIDELYKARHYNKNYGYTLKIIGDNHYMTQNGIKTKYVRYDFDRIEKECKKVKKTAIIRLLSGG